MAHFRYSPLLLKESCKDIYKLHCAYIKQKCWSFNRQGHLSRQAQFSLPAEYHINTL